MIKKIHVKNFKSLSDVEFDLMKSKNKIKNLAIVYGENGSGKTNLIQVLEFLKFSLVNLKQVNALEGNEGLKFFETAQSQLNDYSSYISVGADENAEIKIVLDIEGQEVEYLLAFNKDGIKKESLSYIAKDKKRITEFSIDENLIDISKVSKEEKYHDELVYNIHKYWGKYSFLSIMLLEYNKNNYDFMRDNVHHILAYTIGSFINIYTSTAFTNMEGFYEYIKRFVFTNEEFLMNPTGTINVADEYKLDAYQDVFRNIFTEMYSDVKDVRYTKNKSGDEDNSQINYELVFDKVIGGKVVEIPVQNESKGTKQILNILMPIMKAVNGGVVLIDEVDDGIHDLLMKVIFKSISDKIAGQLIVTTHNTYLLDKDIFHAIGKDKFYIIETDYLGYKEINSLSKYVIKKTNNPRDMYMKGLFKGISMIDGDIEIDSLSDIYAQTLNDNDNGA